jgi:hypothetical protein
MAEIGKHGWGVQATEQLAGNQRFCAAGKRIEYGAIIMARRLAAAISHTPGCLECLVRVRGSRPNRQGVLGQFFCDPNIVGDWSIAR